MFIRSGEDLHSELKHVDLNPFFTGSSRRNSSDSSDDFLGEPSTRVQYSPPTPTLNALKPHLAPNRFHHQFQKEGLHLSTLLNLHSLQMDAFQAVAPPPHVDLDPAETAKSSPVAHRFDGSPDKGSRSSPGSPRSPSGGLRFREKGEQQTPTTPIRPSGRSGNSGNSSSGSNSNSNIPVTSPVGRGRGPTPRPRPNTKEKTTPRSPSASWSVDPELDLPPKESPTNATPLPQLSPASVPASSAASNGKKSNNKSPASSTNTPEATATTTTAAAAAAATTASPNLGNSSRGRGRFHSPKAFSEVHSSGYGKVSPRVSHLNHEPGSPNSPYSPSASNSGTSSTSSSSSSSASSSSSSATVKKRSSSAGTKPLRPWAKTGGERDSAAGGQPQHRFTARPSPKPSGSSSSPGSTANGGATSSSRSGARAGTSTGSSHGSHGVDHYAARSPSKRQGGTWPAERSDAASVFGNAYSGTSRHGARSHSGAAWQRPTQGGFGDRSDQQRQARDSAWNVLADAKSEWLTRRRRSDGKTVPTGPSFDKAKSAYVNKDAIAAVAAAEAVEYASSLPVSDIMAGGPSVPALEAQKLLEEKEEREEDEAANVSSSASRDVDDSKDPERTAVHPSARASPHHHDHREHNNNGNNNNNNDNDDGGDDEGTVHEVHAVSDDDEEPDWIGGGNNNSNSRSDRGDRQSKVNAPAPNMRGVSSNRSSSGSNSSSTSSSSSHARPSGAKIPPPPHHHQYPPPIQGAPPLREGEETVTVIFEGRGPLGLSLSLMASDSGLHNAGIWASNGRALLSLTATSSSSSSSASSSAHRNSESSLPASADSSRSRSRDPGSRSRDRRILANFTPASSSSSSSSSSAGAAGVGDNGHSQQLQEELSNGALSPSSTPNPRGAGHSNRRPKRRSSHSRGSSRSGSHSPSPSPSRRNHTESSSFLDEKAHDSLLVGTTGGGYLGFGSGRPPGVPVAPPPDVCVSYVKISGSGAGSQNARALGVRVGDRLVAVTSRSLGPTPDARDAAIDLAAGRPERGAQCHPLAALRWRRGVGGAALTKVLASLQRPLTLTLARSSAAGALSTVSQEDTSKAAKHSRKAMGNTLAAARAAWEDRVDASQAHHHHHHSSLGGGSNTNGTGGGLDHDHHPHATSASTPRPTKPDGPALAWTTAMAFRARSKSRYDAKRQQRAARRAGGEASMSPDPGGRHRHTSTSPEGGSGRSATIGPGNVPGGGGGESPLERGLLAARIAARKRASPRGTSGGIGVEDSLLPSRGEGRGRGLAALGAGIKSKWQNLRDHQRSNRHNHQQQHEAASLSSSHTFSNGDQGDSSRDRDPPHYNDNSNNTTTTALSEVPTTALATSTILAQASDGDYADDDYAEEWMPAAEATHHKMVHGRDHMSDALASAADTWQMRASLEGDGQRPSTTVAKGPKFERPDQVQPSFSERYIPEKEESDRAFGVRSRDNMGLELASAKALWEMRVLDENTNKPKSTIVQAPAMDRRKPPRLKSADLSTQRLVDREFAEQLFAQGRAHMSETLQTARQDWEARTMVGRPPDSQTLGGLSGISETSVVARKNYTVATAPSMEQRLGPRVLPEKFVERQAEDQLAMLQGRARMATTLVNAKEEFHKRNGGTIVQSDWSYSGLAGKTMSPVWNSKVGKWERRAYGVAPTGSQTASQVAAVKAKDWVEVKVAEDLAIKTNRQAMADKLAEAREKWKKDRAKGHTSTGSAPTMVQREEARNLLLYGSGSAI